MEIKNKMILMRGIARSGKSSWIKENGLEDYVVSLDKILYMFNGSELNMNTAFGINFYNMKKALNIYKEVLENRMKQEKLVIIDNTNLKRKDMKDVLKLATKYNYKTVVLEVNTPFEQILKNNKSVKEKELSRKVLEKQKENKEKDQQWFEDNFTIYNKETINNFLKPVNLDKYKKIIHIGDIHGNFGALDNILKGEIRKDYFYVFLGDYIDRGPENDKVLKFLMNIIDYDNVVCLRGNHELWLKRHYIDKINIKSKEFKSRTLPQLEKTFKDEEIIDFYNKLGNHFEYEYNGQIFQISHGGINIPVKTMYMLGTEAIHGVGGYDDVLDVDKSYSEYSKVKGNKYVQVHGHRSYKDKKLNIYENVYNLDGGEETIAMLEVMKKEGKNNFKVKETFKKLIEISDIYENITNKEIKKLLTNKFTDYKLEGDIIIIKFKPEVFYNNIYNQDTVKARGIFYNYKTNKIVLRGYDKFFNYGEYYDLENDDTKDFKVNNLKSDSLDDYYKSNKKIWLEEKEKTLKFPVTVYEKYNGFLGLLSYSKEEDKIYISSKNTLKGNYKEYFYNLLKLEDVNSIKEVLKEYSDYSFVFEVIDIENDPHYVDYDYSTIVLLDGIEKRLDKTVFLSFDELEDISKRTNLKLKRKEKTIKDFKEMIDLIENNYLNVYHEGFVLRDENDFMFKVKSNPYNNRKKLNKLFTRHIKKNNFQGFLNDIKLEKKYNSYFEIMFNRLNNKPYIFKIYEKVDFFTFIEILETEKEEEFINQINQIISENKELFLDDYINNLLENTKKPLMFQQIKNSKDYEQIFDKLFISIERDIENIYGFLDKETIEEYKDKLIKILKNL